jgi:hypothetical protein
MAEEISSRERRLELIRAIQKNRESQLITYLTGTRQGATAQIGRDAVRPMYNHLREIGFEGVPRIDLFLYSQGGLVDVPWPMVTMLREYCEELNVLIPYRAHSAATLIALGADSIVMGKKGELGPIDPIVTRVEHGEQTVFQESMSVEDIMAYIAFLKERAGLGDQVALADSVSILAEKLTPWKLGAMYRTHSHIRLIARKLLSSHKERLDERVIESIVEALTEKLYFHGHAVGWREAEEIGLCVEPANEERDDLMWRLFEMYEGLMRLNQPIDAKGIIPPNENEYEEPIVIACIESEARLDVFRGTLKLRHMRQMPPQLNLNLNLNLQLPPSVQPQQLPEAVQNTVQQMLQQLQQQISAMVQAELAKQAPIQRTEGNLLNASWQEATSEGI